MENRLLAFVISVVALTVTFVGRASADEPMPTTASTEATAPPAPPPTPPPYAMPFQLRPAGVSNVARIDFAIAGYNGGATLAPMFMGAYKLRPDLSVMFRIGYSALFPSGGSSSGALTNPLIGATYAPPISPNVRLAFFGAFAAPFGQGGGDTPDAAQVAALGAGRAARSAMDNTLFATNYATVVVGAGAAYLWNHFTFQVDLTLLQGFRARGPEAQDGSVTNSTENLWVGYSVLPALTVGVELRHQRFLSTPASVRANAAARDQTTFGLGVRTRIVLSDHVAIPLGVSYSRAIDAPMSTLHYNIVMVDIPFVFQ